MRRMTLSLGVALLVSALALPVAARTDGGCPSGQGVEPFFVGTTADAQSFADTYPTVGRAIDDGIVSLGILAGTLEAVDKNDNGWVCVKDVYAWSTEKSGGANAQNQGFFYYVNAVDDNAAPR